MAKFYFTVVPHGRITLLLFNYGIVWLSLALPQYFMVNNTTMV